jgi:hypothetical protein
MPWSIPVPPEPALKQQQAAPHEDAASELNAETAAEVAAAAATAKARLVPGLGLDLLEQDDLFSAPAAKSEFAASLQQRRLQEEAEVKAKGEAAAAARLAAAAAGDAEACSTGRSTGFDPLIVSSNLFPVVAVAAGSSGHAVEVAAVDDAAATAAVAAAGLQAPVLLLPGSVPSAAAAGDAAASYAAVAGVVRPVADGVLDAQQPAACNPAAAAAAAVVRSLLPPLDAVDGCMRNEVEQQQLQQQQQPEKASLPVPADGATSSSDAAAATSADAAAPLVPATASGATAGAPAVASAIADVQLTAESAAAAIESAAQGVPPAAAAIVAAAAAPRLYGLPSFSLLGPIGPRKQGQPAAAVPSSANRRNGDRAADIDRDYAGSYGSARAHSSSAAVVSGGSSNGSMAEHASGAISSSSRASTFSDQAGFMPQHGSSSSSAAATAAERLPRFFAFAPQHEAEAAAHAAGLISERVEVPQQLLAAVSLQLPAAPEEPMGAAAATDAAAVGRFGEELAYQYYLQHPDIQQQQQQSKASSLLFAGSSDGKKQRQRQVMVEWVNQEGESGLPYDLVLYEQPGTNGSSNISSNSSSNSSSGGSSDGSSCSAIGHLAEGAQVLAYVEVKASRDASRQLFYITERELEFARQQGSRYHILRVGLPIAAAAAAGGVLEGVEVLGAPSMQRLVDPVRLWAEHVIRVCIAV